MNENEIEYVLKEDFENELEKLKENIKELQTGKADKKTLSKIREEISILNEKINEMKDDNKEYREALKELTNTVNKNNITNATIITTQKVNEEKLIEMKEDLHELVVQMSAFKTTMDNSFWNTFCRLYNQYKIIKIIVWILSLTFVVVLVSACMFYTSNAEYAQKFKNVYDFLKGL